MRIGSLFSGIGGLELGLERAGIGHTVWQVENNEKLHPCLAEHWPHAERHLDVCAVGARNLSHVDLICGGFPCQDVSSAGARAGLAGARSGLWYEFARVVGELSPRWVVVENVASGAAKWVDAVRGDLERRGYASLPVPLQALDLGAAHERARVFVVAARPADAYGTELRNEPGRLGGTDWSRSEVAACMPADADAEGQLQQGRGECDLGRWSCDAPGIWSSEPDVVRMVHGLPARLDRERALGNSVVPQCAEVIGYMIRELRATL